VLGKQYKCTNQTFGYIPRELCCQADFGFGIQ
jgi:hypothetical protein